jgi:hypothetical protein
METRWSEEGSEEPTAGESATQPQASFEEIRARLEAWSERTKVLIRERPTTFLLGALAVGYVVARLARRGR